ncbi:DNA repair protein XRCC3 [Drosophila elegans]|uniref:DNA repair protein XRCC3 n=1 Tax=Drosophila elegans TaxID=30023 RepID=UPI0007E88F21|nr:DNA repair protein XRCC3 [Drosophila elegans]XP_017117355.1 DNA repair protein XRCC3 [Drosophila elegans]
MTNFLDQLPKRIREIAEQVNVLAPEEVLTTPPVRFLDTRQESLYTVVRQCTPDDVRVLKDAAAKWLAEMPQTADSLFKPLVNVRWSRVSFGCSALDRCTGGGVVTRGITELCGAAGVGKSQLLLQLSLCVQLPTELGGLGKGVAYICTEDAFPARRLLQMSKACEKRHPKEKLNFLGNIFVEHHYETEPLLNCIRNRLPRLMQQHGVGLIIIDSVAAIFRLYTDFLERARQMRRLADALLTYADKYNCAVVCVNQVAASGGQDEVPCLGLQWAHLGRTRLRVSRVPKQHRMGDQLITVRKLDILYSPETPNDFAEFLITEEGVVDVPEPTPTRPPAKMRRL